VTDNKDLKRFAKLGYEDFRRMATDPGLSPHEKIGFPDSYRAGFEARILADIRAKLPALDETERRVLDIGPGCGPLATLIIDHCRARRHQLGLVDSAEMLAHLPDEAFITKWAAYYPDCPGLFETQSGSIDALLSYSVFHYIFTESSIYRFLDRSLDLLAPGGQMLIGDIPNVSMRKRFFSSPAGIRFHQAFTGRDELPQVRHGVIESEQIDDSIVMSILMRARAAGFESYLLPQAADLPMANRREDILIRRH
jgi:SAM-dependent methyltransferase